MPIDFCLRWTGFDPHLYSGGSSSAGTALVESGNCKVSFILSRGIVTEATPWSQDGVQCIPLYQSCCQPGRFIVPHILLL